MMYNVFCQKFQISMRTIHEFSIAITREFVLLTSRCNHLIMDFLITASKCWTEISIHSTGAASPMYM